MKIHFLWNSKYKQQLDTNYDSLSNKVNNIVTQIYSNYEKILFTDILDLYKSKTEELQLNKTIVTHLE